MMNTLKDNSNIANLDAYSPSRIAQLVDKVGVTKAKQPKLKTVVLGVLAGVFIAFGAMLFTLIITESNLGFGVTKLLGGIGFSLGLILVVVAGAELFTGNNLIIMAWANGEVQTRAILVNWAIVYVANFIGAVLAAYAMYWSGLLEESNGIIKSVALQIAHSKIATSTSELFIRGILCNTLVCLAVWLCMAAHDVASKAVAIIFPISTFVALGFEHSIANMYFIPLGMIISSGDITMYDLFHNLLPVTLGNIIGGSVFVALIYWIVYIRD
jgi:formate/nitrite transporter